MNIITLDFESFYSQTYSLSKITTEEYVRGNEFEVIGVSTKINDGPITWVTGKAVKAHLESLPWDSHLMLAQNTAFDAFILQDHYGITPVGYLDTMSMANAIHGISESSSLKNLAVLYNEAEKGDAVVKAKGKHLADFTPDELAEYGDYCMHDTELCYNILQKMLPNFPMTELRVVDLTIRMFAQPKLMLDAGMLVEDLMNIRAAKRGALLTLMNALGVKNEEALKTQIMSNDKFAALLQSYGCEPPTKISEKTGKVAWAFAKTDEEFTDLAASDDPIVATMVATRLETKSTIMETRTDSYAQIAERGAYPFSLLYSGAKITHRWSGFDTNPQNLPRKSTLRQAIMAPAGHTLVVADLSNIELRLGMWLAGQADAVAQIREGVDLYRAFAAEAFNMKYEDIGKDSTERFVAKVCQLSLLYQTGADKLRNTIRLQSKGKTTVTAGEAEHFKNLYRAKYDKVVNAWQEGNNALGWILNGEAHTLFGFLPVLGIGGIIKPNGLALAYPQLRREFGPKGEQYVYTMKRGRANVVDKVYGGKCFQRCTQSLARDIMAEMTVNINKKYWVAGLVHDEVICIVPDDEVEEAKVFIEQAMSTPPSWAPDLPLACEVGSGKRYGSAK